MNEQSFDIIVVGGGVGGYTAALRAASLGASVGMVEENLIGGTCVNVGCIPTKALLEGARLVRRAERSSEFGVRIDGVRVDTGRMVSRWESIVSVIRKGMEELLARRNVSVLSGRGIVASPSQIDLSREGRVSALKAESIIIATGSEWIDLPGVKVDGRRIITSDHALAIEEVPTGLVIIGGGAVGCEFAEIYSALGTKVTVVEMMDHILPGEDTELAGRLETSLKRKGITVMVSSKVAGVEEHGDGLSVIIEGEQPISASKVMVAVGRRPRTAGMGLEDIGIPPGPKGIDVDASMRTGVPGIFAVGDVTGRYLLAHVAMAQGIAAGENACGQGSLLDYRAVPRCTYTDPELASVGLSEAELMAGGNKPLVGRMRLGRVGRALTLGETFGLAKIVCDADGRVLGFHVLAPHASEVVSEVSLAVSKGLTVGDISDLIHPHPTLSEIVWESALGASGKPIHGG